MYVSNINIFLKSNFYVIYVIQLFFLPQGENHGVKNAEQAGILDLYVTKHWAVKHAADVVNTVLRVDQVSYSFMHCDIFMQYIYSSQIFKDCVSLQNLNFLWETNIEQYSTKFILIKDFTA